MNSKRINKLFESYFNLLHCQLVKIGVAHRRMFYVRVLRMPRILFLTQNVSHLLATPLPPHLAFQVFHFPFAPYEQGHALMYFLRDDVQNTLRPSRPFTSCLFGQE